jgi:hypothetical protein
MPDIDVSSLTNPLYIGNGPNRTKFEIDGTIVAEGTATAFDDVIGQLTGAQLFETPGKADYDFDECAVMFQPGGSIANDGDCVVMSFQIPHSAKAEAPFHLHAHYYQTDATARTFQYQYRVRSAGTVKPAWSSVVTVSTSTANALPYIGSPMDQIASLGDISLLVTWK